jgi:hypothetical protein
MQPLAAGGGVLNIHRLLAHGLEAPGASNTQVGIGFQKGKDKKKAQNTPQKKERKKRRELL